MKKFFPWSYSKAGLLIGLIYYILVALVASLIIGFANVLVGWIPVVGAIVAWALRIVGIIVDAWVVIGIVLRVLVTLKIVK